VRKGKVWFIAWLCVVPIVSMAGDGSVIFLSGTNANAQHYSLTTFGNTLNEAVDNEHTLSEAIGMSNYRWSEGLRCQHANWWATIEQIDVNVPWAAGYGCNGTSAQQMITGAYSYYLNKSSGRPASTHLMLHVEYGFVGPQTAIAAPNGTGRQVSVCVFDYDSREDTPPESRLKLSMVTPDGESGDLSQCSGLSAQTILALLK
jgi:hypothetical protein